MVRKHCPGGLIIVIRVQSSRRYPWLCLGGGAGVANRWMSELA